MRSIATSADHRPRSAIRRKPDAFIGQIVADHRPRFNIGPEPSASR
jgi:hypothetical protein